MQSKDFVVCAIICLNSCWLHVYTFIYFVTILSNLEATKVTPKNRSWQFLLKYTKELLISHSNCTYTAHLKQIKCNSKCLTSHQKALWDHVTMDLETKTRQNNQTAKKKEKQKIGKIELLQIRKNRVYFSL